jgi:hypothetical protein
MRPIEFLELGGARRTPYIQQSEASECGPAVHARLMRGSRSRGRGRRCLCLTDGRVGAGIACPRPSRHQED